MTYGIRGERLSEAVISLSTRVYGPRMCGMHLLLMT